MVTLRAVVLVVSLVVAGYAAGDAQVAYSFSLGGTYGKVKTLLNGGDQAAAATSDWALEPYLNVGAHLRYSGQHEFGIVVGHSNVDSVSLWSFRPLDYKYMLFDSFLLKGFFGVARYDRETPAHGYYLGTGFEFRPVASNYGINLELAYGDKIARDRVLPSDPPQQGASPEIFYDAYLVNGFVSFYF